MHLLLTHIRIWFSQIIITEKWTSAHRCKIDYYVRNPMWLRCIISKKVKMFENLLSVIFLYCTWHWYNQRFLRLFIWRKKGARNEWNILIGKKSYEVATHTLIYLFSFSLLNNSLQSLWLFQTSAWQKVFVRKVKCDNNH